MSSLYFIQAELTRRIKIGVAKNPAQRLRLHQTGSPDRLKLLIDVRYENSRDAYIMERRLHREYGTERATGEWFEETERLLREVAGLQAIKIAQSRGILEASLANQNPKTAYPRKGPDRAVKPVGVEEHLAKPELRKRIREMLASGMTQAAIARQLHKSVSTIAFHVRNIGIPPKEYTTPEPIVRGKRQCAECGRSKTLGAFPTPRVAVCSVCRRSQRKTSLS